MQRISDQGIELLKELEGCRLKAYKCPSGTWTIGYGHTSKAGSPDVYKGMKITQEEAESIFRKDLLKYEEEVNEFIDEVIGYGYSTTVRQSLFDIFVSFHYNTGSISKAIWAKRAVWHYMEDNHNYRADSWHPNILDEIRDDFYKWNKSNGNVVQGLVNRRKKEWTYMIINSALNPYIDTKDINEDNNPVNVKNKEDKDILYINKDTWEKIKEDFKKGGRKYSIYEICIITFISFIVLCLIISGHIIG
jgi:GH24 family phage-related lysozyme (muramidase)